jgi:hypothetical protein
MSPIADIRQMSPITNIVRAPPYPLYDETARSLAPVDARLRVPGPFNFANERW